MEHRVKLGRIRGIPEVIFYILNTIDIYNRF